MDVVVLEVGCAAVIIA